MRADSADGADCRLQRLFALRERARKHRAFQHPTEYELTPAFVRRRSSR